MEFQCGGWMEWIVIEGGSWLWSWFYDDMHMTCR
jgi:hypothetical protein